jgi:hypothetical protein
MDEAASSSETAGTRKEIPYPSGESMKADPFDSTPDFRHFKEVMSAVLAVPKTRLDELVRAAKEHSPRNGDPHAPGQKRAANRGKRKRTKL